MKALIFYALLEQFFIELNQLIPLPNWSNLVFLQYKYNKNSFIGVPCSCVENNLRVRKTFAMALFWKILLPSFMENYEIGREKQPKPPETIEFTQNTSKIWIQHA